MTPAGIETATFEKNVIEHKISVSFSLQLLSEKVFILRRMRCDII